MSIRIHHQGFKGMILADSRGRGLFPLETSLALICTGIAIGFCFLDGILGSIAYMYVTIFQYYALMIYCSVIVVVACEAAKSQNGRNKQKMEKEDGIKRIDSIVTSLYEGQSGKDSSQDDGRKASSSSVIMGI